MKILDKIEIKVFDNATYWNLRLACNTCKNIGVKTRYLLANCTLLFPSKRPYQYLKAVYI